MQREESLHPEKKVEYAEKNSKENLQKRKEDKLIGSSYFFKFWNYLHIHDNPKKKERIEKNLLIAV